MCNDLAEAMKALEGKNQRAAEEWEWNVCENKAVAILNKMQQGKKTEEKCSLP